MIKDTDIPMPEIYADMLNSLSAIVHRQNKAAGWWKDLDSIKAQLKHERDREIVEMWCVGTKYLLMHCEISEAVEAYRKGLNDDHLPHRKGREVEGADLLLRKLDVDGFFKDDVGGALVEKHEYNRNRADHKLENRAKSGGKKF